jgi:hypothetical protein
MADPVPAPARHRLGQKTTGDTTTLKDYRLLARLREEEE